MTQKKRRVFSIGRWSPALRTMVTSATAHCGCGVGVYQAWDGGTLSVVDMAYAGCPSRHRQGDVLVAGSAAAAPAERGGDHARGVES